MLISNYNLVKQISKSNEKIKHIKNIVYSKCSRTVQVVVQYYPTWYSPRGSNAEMKISMNEELNPIKQEVKEGKLAYIRNCISHQIYMWNVGAFPQTAEQCTKLPLQNVEILEIGHCVPRIGDIIKIKLLGGVGLKSKAIKVIGIDVNDPWAASLDYLSSVMADYPGLLCATTEFLELQNPLEVYETILEMRQINYVRNMLEETHKQWSRYIRNPCLAGNFSPIHVCDIKPSNKIERSEAQKIVDKILPPEEP